jgi:hypothetical protein
MMASASRNEVSRNVAMGGGTTAVMRTMVASSITPGPLGMEETRPRADAPCAMASRASAGDLMQQIFTRGRIGGDGRVENCSACGKRVSHPEHPVLRKPE